MPPARSPGTAGRGGEVTPPSKPQSPLRITHEGEFYARLLTRDSSQGNPSFRYYGAGTGAVPFLWESQPGTPKDAYSSSSRMLMAAAAPAAITPPPSYHLRGAALGAHSARRHGGKGAASGGGGKYCCGYKLKWVKVSFMATVFRRLAFGNNKSRSSTSSSVKSSSSSSTRWLFSAGSNAAAVVDDVEAPDQEEYCGYDEPARARARPTTKGVICLGIRPGPWMMQFCSGQRERQLPGWVYGWRP
ncbi:hypothetical protein U9M48_044308 [Paspalum notatum var. saurae]|uniref:Uncharacterized protein n=1 Tax=Paspalum notatum var. saurae TaxID=547442 RepID=A0AAQ3XHD1_PASNO